MFLHSRASATIAKTFATISFDSTKSQRHSISDGDGKLHSEDGNQKRALQQRDRLPLASPQPNRTWVLLDDVARPSIENLTNDVDIAIATGLRLFAQLALLND